MTEFQQFLSEYVFPLLFGLAAAVVLFTLETEETHHDVV